MGKTLSRLSPFRLLVFLVRWPFPSSIYSTTFKLRLEMRHLRLSIGFLLLSHPLVLLLAWTKYFHLALNLSNLQPIISFLTVFFTLKALLLEINDPRGVCMETLWDGPGLPFAGSLIMLSVDIVLYIFLAYYLDNVLPSND